MGRKKQQSKGTGKTIIMIVFVLTLIGILLKADVIYDMLPNTYKEVVAESGRILNEQFPTSSTHFPPTNTTTYTSDSTITIMSWNLCHLGKTKSKKEIAVMANVMKDYDIVGVQEVNVGPDGAKAISYLVSELNRKGSKWDYILSDPTDGAGRERYAYLYKTKNLKVKNRWLSKPMKNKLDREPFMARFETKSKQTILIANFHAVPKGKNPESEIAQLDDLHKLYEEDNLVIIGDFNLNQYSAAFYELKKEGYSASLFNKGTTLKKTENNGKYINEPYDNIFYERSVLKKKKSGVIDVVKIVSSLEEARNVSDHLPVWAVLEWK